MVASGCHVSSAGAPAGPRLRKGAPTSSVQGDRAAPLQKGEGLHPPRGRTHEGVALADCAHQPPVTLTVTLQRTARGDCNRDAQTPGGRAPSACEGGAPTVGTRSRTPLPESHFLGLSDVRAKWAREEAVTPGSPPGGRATLSGAGGPQSEPLCSPGCEGRLVGSGGRIPRQDPNSCFPCSGRSARELAHGPFASPVLCQAHQELCMVSSLVAAGRPVPTPATRDASPENAQLASISCKWQKSRWF